MATLRKKQHTCTDCGEPNADTALECRACGSMRLNTAGYCRPTIIDSLEDSGLPWPMSLLYCWPASHSVSISGNPGSGKSTIAMILGSFFAGEKTFAIFTSEQTGKQIGTLIQRVIPHMVSRVQIYITKGAKQFLTALDDVVTDFIILDSLSALAGYEEQVTILNLIDDWLITGTNRRALIILQNNARGEGAGKLELKHLVDAVTDIDVRDGLRVLNATKNRAGPVGSQYFKLTAKGPDKVTFKYSYSVEGEPGNYRLHAWPLPGARWNGLLDVMNDAHSLRPGIACAAIPVECYPGGALQPDDVDDRKRFAEAHGLIWINPENED